jgi:predicted nucleic acid-binding protein
VPRCHVPSTGEYFRLETAVEASVDAIVTGDDDLLALESYERIPIVPARAFLELLNGQRRRLP